MSALDEINKKTSKAWTPIETVIWLSSMGLGDPQWAEKAAAEFEKLQADYTNAIKANAEVARLNTDLQEQLAAQAEAIAAAREILAEIESNWTLDGIYEGSYETDLSARAIKQLAAALAKLGE